MDILLYAKVLWRFRALVAAGVLLAFALAVLAMAKPTLDGGKPGLAYRTAETWQASTTLFITQTGFPWGRTVFPPAQEGKAYPYGDEGRLANLASLYSEFASSDAVQRIVARRVKGAASISAGPVTSPTGTATPLMNIFGRATTAERALEVTRIGTQAFREFLDQQQDGAGIPTNQRVKVNVLKGASSPLVVEPRKKTLPLVVFMAVLSATIALAFLLENARPQVRSLSTVGAAGVSETRRSA